MAFLGKLFKLAFILAILGVLAGGGSYAAAYFAQGKIASVDDALGQRHWKLDWKGYDSLPGKPRAWIFTYTNPKVSNLRNPTIVVSLTGKVLLTKPRDLPERVDRWREARQTVD